MRDASTAPESTISINPDAFDEAFVVYEEAWRVRIDAQADPGSPELRQRIAQLYVEPARSRILGGLDAQLENGQRAIPRDGFEDRAELLVRKIAVSEDGEGAAIFTVCLIETDIIVNTLTDETVFDQLISYTNDVDMIEEGGRWFVRDEGILIETLDTDQCVSP